MLKKTVLLLFVLFGTNLFAQDEFRWYHQYGSDEGREYARSIIAEDDGSFTVIGKTEVTENGQGDILLMRFGSNGDSLFSVQYDIGADDYPRDFMKVEDYYIAYGGSKNEEQGTAYYWLSVINEDLELENVMLFETETWYVSEAIPTSSGNFLMVGDDCLIVNMEGDVLAQPDVDFETLRSVIEMDEGRYAVLKNESGRIFELNDNLEIQDTLSFWGETYDLIKGTDNSIYRIYWPLCECNSKIIAKYNLNWELLWEVDYLYGGFFRLFEDVDMLYAIDQYTPLIVSINKENGEASVSFRLPLNSAYLNDYIFREDDIVCVGEIEEDIWIGALDRNPAKVSQPKNRIIPDQMELSVYPNPFNSTATINYSINNQSEIGIQIYNTSGQLVDVLLNQVMPVGQHSVVWDAGSAPAGIYFVRLNTKNEIFLQKTLLVK